MAAIDLLLSLTEKGTGDTFKLSAGNIISMYLDPITPGTGSVIVYDLGDLATTRQITVTQTPASIYSAAKSLIPVTISGSVEYIGVDRIVLVVEFGSGSKITYYNDGTSTTTITVEETPAAIQALVALQVAQVGTSSMIATFIPTAAENTLTGSGAVIITNYKTSINSTGGGAITLANGSQTGQLKKIVMTVDAGDSTLTLTGYTSIVFNDAADFVILMWGGSAWFVIENSGATVNA